MIEENRMGAEGERRRSIGRYVLCDEIAAGGMATVHIGRLMGAVGFSRAVAIKRLHAPFARDPEFVGMFRDEARLASRIRHNNVVPIVDVVLLEGELLLVMEYVHGESVSRLMKILQRTGEKMPVPVAVAVAVGILQGLHAAHEATDEKGQSLEIVHRDVSPQNILLGVDGVPRLLDFGVAKAAGQFASTRAGVMKGKVAYMAPEQVLGDSVDPRTDIYAASAVLWEMLTGERLFSNDTPVGALARTLDEPIEPPSEVVAGIAKELDAIVLKGLSSKKGDRFQSANEMAAALEDAVKPASTRETADWLKRVAASELRERAARVEAIERDELPSGETLEEERIERRPSRHEISQADTRSGGELRAREALRKRNARRVAIGLGILGAFLAGSAAALYFRPNPAKSDVSPLPTPTPNPTGTSPATSPTTSTSTTPSTSTPTASATPTTTAVSIPTPAHDAGKRVRPTGTGAGTGSAKPDKKCDPPYTIGPDGIHIPKPECI